MELVPGKRIGPFAFDQAIPSGVDKHLRKIESDEFGSFPWGQYEYAAPDGCTYAVYVRDGLVSNVDCDERCFVNGHNLIGETIDRIERLLGVPAVPQESVEMSSGTQAVFTLDAAGVQVWLQDGVAVTVQCSSSENSKP